MDTPLTPNDIMVLMWYYGSPVAHPQKDTPGVKYSTMMWLQAGMIEPSPFYRAASGVYRDTDYDSGIYRTTAKGDAMVKALCETPEPVQVWVPGKKEQ